MSEPWLERWQEGRIGWHEASGNKSLQKFWTARGRRVLVPLCGKSQDLLWLESQGNDVVGVELSEIAVRDFFEENGIDFKETGSTFVATDRSITIICGDFFSIDRDDSPFNAHFDRGALAALPSDVRPRYAVHTSSLLTDDAYQLVITLSYKQSAVDGPPFSIPEVEVLSYWPTLECIDRYNDLDNCPPKFRDAGLTEVYELIWRSR